MELKPKSGQLQNFDPDNEKYIGTYSGNYQLPPLIQRVVNISMKKNQIYQCTPSRDTDDQKILQSNLPELEHLDNLALKL